MNSSMLLPQVAERDVFDANGRQLDDVNSAVEYVRVALGYDHTPDDEDDDDGQNFHLVKCAEYCFEQPVSRLEQHRKTDAILSVRFTRYIESSFKSVFLEVATPPPDIA